MSVMNVDFGPITAADLRSAAAYAAQVPGPDTVLAAKLRALADQMSAPGARLVVVPPADPAAP